MKAYAIQPSNNGFIIRTAARVIERMDAQVEYESKVVQGKAQRSRERGGAGVGSGINVQIFRRPEGGRKRRMRRNWPGCREIANTSKLPQGTPHSSDHEMNLEVRSETETDYLKKCFRRCL